MRRAVVLLSTAFLIVVPALPAVAHSAGGFSPSNFRTVLKDVTPQLPGLELSVIESGSRFQLENRTDEEAVVIGYQKEPYLRVGPDGVLENVRSPATYLNKTRTGQITVPGSADPKAEPEWKKVSSEPVARWHDHRIHWMGAQDPPAVKREPDKTHVVIPGWVLPVRQGDVTIEATGDLLWVPGPSSGPWLALAAALLAVTLLVATRYWGGPVLVGLVTALVALDIVHAAGTSFSVAAPTATQLGRVLSSSPASPVAWVLGGVSIWMLLRERAPGVGLAGVVAATVALSGGLVDLADLSKSQVPFIMGATAARLFVVASLGVGLGVAVACVLAVLRTGAPRQPAPA